MLERIYRIERAFVAGATGLMGVLVFLDVVHRMATRERSVTATSIIAVASFVVVFLALRTRGTPKTTPLQLGVAALAVVGLASALKLFVWVMPNGLVWSQTLGLVLMLWVAVIGASMATHEHRHLSLDLGSKLWPKSMLPHVQAIGNVVTACFCFTLGLLSVVSLRSHLGDWQDTAGAGGHFAALELPKWIAFSILPVGMGIMAVRFLAQAVASWRGKVEEDDALHMLGLDTSSSATEPKP